MSVDNDLNLTLEKLVSNGVIVIELLCDTNTRKFIFQEYKEWLGSSIDDWFLALPDKREKFVATY